MTRHKKSRAREGKTVKKLTFCVFREGLSFVESIKRKKCFSSVPAKIYFEVFSFPEEEKCQRREEASIKLLFLSDGFKWIMNRRKKTLFRFLDFHDEHISGSVHWHRAK